MSEPEERDLLPLLVMLESLGKIGLYVSRFENADDFFNDSDQAKFNASLLLLLNIGEYASKLSPALKNSHQNLPIQEIRGLRNRIAHNYIGIDYEMVFDIIQNDLPPVKARLLEILQVEVGKGTFDRGELEAARSSNHYRHIDFYLFM